MIGPGGPRYQRIAADLRSGIRLGRFRPGQMLPSETTLAQTFDVGVGTIRNALSVLRQEGLLVTRQGYGTYVAEELPVQVTYARKGIQISSRMPTPEEREKWDIPDGAVIPMLIIGDEAWPADRYVAQMGDD